MFFWKSRSVTNETNRELAIDAVNSPTCPFRMEKIRVKYNTTVKSNGL
jgi:hypothetical protein